MARGNECNNRFSEFKTRKDLDGVLKLVYVIQLR